MSSATKRTQGGGLTLSHGLVREASLFALLRVLDAGELNGESAESTLRFRDGLDKLGL